MTFLASAAAYLATVIGERNTWESRADQAWGTSRNWPDGTSWETDRNNWYNQAQAWYTSRYNDGYSAGNAAGYAAADAAESPAPLTVQDATIGATVTTATQVLQTFTATRTGQYHLSGWLQCAQGGTNQWRVDLRVAGGTVTSGPQTWMDGTSGHIRMAHYRGFVTAGQSMQLVSVLLGGSLGSITANGAFMTTFVPVPGNQQ